MNFLTQYILDIIFVIILLVTVIQCGKRGLFKTLMRFARIVLAAVAAYFFGSRVATFLADKFLAKRLYDLVYNKIEGIYQKAAESFDAQKILSSFPNFLINDSMREQIGSMEETGEELVVSATDSISGVLTKIVSTVLGYVLVFIVALILLAIVTAIIGAIIKRLEVLGTMDHVLGAVFGVAVAWVLLTIVCSLLKFFCAEEAFYTQSRAVKFLAETPVTKFLKFLDLDGLLSKAFKR